MRHLLNFQGRPVCDASPQEAGYSVTNMRHHVSCRECLSPETCQHARDRTPEEMEALRLSRKSPRHVNHPSFCGAPATRVALPDGDTGLYCREHAERVIARIQRRLALRGVRA